MSIPTHLNTLIIRAIADLWIKASETDNDAYETFIFNYQPFVVQNALNKLIEIFDEAHEGWRLSCSYSEGNKYYLQIVKEDYSSS